MLTPGPNTTHKLYVSAPGYSPSVSALLVSRTQEKLDMALSVHVSHGWLKEHYKQP
jgi:hypothetical protein